MIETRVILGRRETPSFVSKEFYDAMLSLSEAQSLDEMHHVDTITYHIPSAFVASPEPCLHTIRIDGQTRMPFCRRATVLHKLRFRYKRPRMGFDRFTVTTEDSSNAYFSLLPHARYDNVQVFTHQRSFRFLFHDREWLVLYRHVFLDPHDYSQTLWLCHQPKYQVELRCLEDLREHHMELRAAVSCFIPSSFR